MSKIMKRVTLHPLNPDGTIDTNTNLYPKTLVTGIVDNLGNDVDIATQQELEDVVASLDDDISTKQEKLISGENIVTINNQSLLDSGDIHIEPITEEEKENIVANTEARHTHDNKEVLDEISQEDVDSWDAKVSANNSTIKILVDNVEVDSFTLNQSNDESINISTTSPISSISIDSNILPIVGKNVDLPVVRNDINNQGLSSAQKVNAKTNLDLENVDNTSDLNKPISTATQTALDTITTNLSNEVSRATGAESDLSGRLNSVEEVIPSQASSQNKLADKEFVNSSIATETATFRGTYNIVTDLGLTIEATEQQIASAIATKLANLSITADKNDYVYVAFPNATVSTHFDKYDKYKYNGTSWGYEYTLNHSSFTAEQWAAINSGITSGLVTQIGANKTDIASLQDDKADKVLPQESGEVINGMLAGLDANGNLTNSYIASNDVVTKSGVQHITGEKYFDYTDTHFKQQIKIQSRGSSEEWMIQSYSGELGMYYNGGTRLILPKSTSSPITAVSIAPDIGNTYSLGASNKKWKDLYLSGNLSDGTNSITIDQIVNNKSSATNLENGTGTNAVQQKMADATVNFIGRNPNAEALDSSLSATLNTGASGNQSASFGKNTMALSATSLSSGNKTVAKGEESHAEGYQSVTLGDGSHAEGAQTVAYGLQSHSEGALTQAIGDNSHAEGHGTIAGSYTNATKTGTASHAEGVGTKIGSHTKDANQGADQSSGGGGGGGGTPPEPGTFVAGEGSHAEGYSNLVVGFGSHAEGLRNYLTGNYAHIEGVNNTNSANYAHVEGFNNINSGDISLIAGTWNNNSGYNAFIVGHHNINTYDNKAVVGRYNGNKSTTLLEVGNGTADNARSNALEVYEDGRITIGANPINNMDVATKKYVDDSILISATDVIYN